MVYIIMVKFKNKHTKSHLIIILIILFEFYLAVNLLHSSLGETKTHLLSYITISIVIYLLDYYFFAVPLSIISYN